MRKVKYLSTLICLIILFSSCVSEKVIVKEISNINETQSNKNNFEKDNHSKAYYQGDTALEKLRINGHKYEKTEEIYITDPDGAVITGKAYPNPNDKGVFIEGRTVTLSPFILGRYEVTQELYSAVMKEQYLYIDGRRFQLSNEPFYCQGEKYPLADGEIQKYRPAEGIGWPMAVYFCNVLSEKRGLKKAYEITIKSIKSYTNGSVIYDADVCLIPNANGYRLPTEAEWEFAARGGNQNKPEWNYTYSGANASDSAFNDKCFISNIDSAIDSIGWYYGNIINGTTVEPVFAEGIKGWGTHEVGKKKPNSLRLYDMSGNVTEWVYDFYTDNIQAEEVINPTGPLTGSEHIFKGGGWFSNVGGCTVWTQRHSKNGYGATYDGFRLARSVIAEE